VTPDGRVSPQPLAEQSERLRRHSSPPVLLSGRRRVAVTLTPLERTPFTPEDMRERQRSLTPRSMAKIGPSDLHKSAYPPGDARSNRVLATDARTWRTRSSFGVFEYSCQPLMTTVATKLDIYVALRRELWYSLRPASSPTMVARANIPSNAGREP
jgi:hypothetical protein